MYRYYKGLVIREGKSGISREKLKTLYVDAGWIQESQSNWQDEKFEFVVQNSTWVYTVLDKDELVAMVRVLSDQVMFATILDLIVKKSHKRKGIGKELVRLCIEKLPHGTWYAHTSSDNYRFYKSCGLHVQDVNESATCVYYGRRKAREDRHLLEQE